MVGGLTGIVVVLSPGSAGAVACGTAVPAGTVCSSTGTLTLTGGALALTSPASLGWSGTLAGTNQSIADIVAVDQQVTVNDATGSGAGWHVTVSATTFTNGAHVLPNAGTFVVTGGLTASTAVTPPTASCVPATTCTVPTNSTAYPVSITTATTAPTAVTIYDTAATTGVGATLIGGSSQSVPLGWWVNVPSNAFAGAYAATLTMAVVSAP